ncbi:MAG: Cof-type HAD-IIB family hydrolase [Candidatus Gastranaerophilales bacterium]|nr:Cof-type HAD-IIB family hydrolase [Candidatus Gastranaerophilales bacterium]
MIKMVVTDIDGTIYSPKTGITENVKTCIRKLKDNGIHVAIATGRTYASAKTVADKIGIKCPLICYQGGLVNSYEGEILNVKYLNADIAREIIKDFRKRNIHLNVYVEDKLYVEDDNQYIKDYIGDKGIDYFKVESFNELDFSKLNKLLAIKYDRNFIDNLIKELQNKYPEIYVVKSFDYFCEIANKQATKGNALKFLADYYGLSEEEVMAIGDQNNDIEMVETAGVGVAMGNGTSEIKQKANYITDTVDNDGFVKAVNKFVWGK